MLSFITRHGVAGLVGGLVAVLMVVVLAPSTPGGVALIVFLCVAVAVIVGTLIGRR
ncbi:MAG: hypothetical protein AAFX81_08970 [Pseudomonadota bacterium]